MPLNSRLRPYMVQHLEYWNAIRNSFGQVACIPNKLLPLACCLQNQAPLAERGILRNGQVVKGQLQML
ncbi:Uncharacterized protein HZ326_13523 [Fusarium oxysporum f. sp. albedinis]|nr:Uncharacterized protein HZ326_13523 [Fusarium oxysporum f. sp. albedinis]